MVQGSLKHFAFLISFFPDWCPKYCNLKYNLRVSSGSLLLSLDGSFGYKIAPPILNQLRLYVDGTFLLFRDPAHANLFLNYFKSKHQNISFTCEIENNNSLPFLDVYICRNSNKFDTKVFRKSTFTGLGTSFFSH